MPKRGDTKSLGRSAIKATDIKLTCWRRLKCQYAGTEETDETGDVFSRAQANVVRSSLR